MDPIHFRDGKTKKVGRLVAIAGVLYNFTDLTWDRAQTNRSEVLDGHDIPLGAHQTQTFRTFSGTVVALEEDPEPPANTAFDLYAEPPVAATVATALGADSDLVWTLKRLGRFGNAQKLKYTDPGKNSASLKIVYRPQIKTIEVLLATDGTGVITSTATQIKTAAATAEVVKDLATVADKNGSDGSGTVTALESTEFSGGAGDQFVLGTVTESNSENQTVTFSVTGSEVANPLILE